jgi:ribose-phosphate pyrophosphokinase
MNQTVFTLPDSESLAAGLAKQLNAETGRLILRRFPDDESYVRVESHVEGKTAIVVASLREPDDKFLPLVFLAAALKDLGAKKIILVAPYLAYMRQDRRFKKGEAVTSVCFARLVSEWFDALVTVDPHLHRLTSLDEIYTIPSVVPHAAPLISNWISENIENPLLVGPDSESEQWVKSVAEGAGGAPYVVLEKVRRGDRDVEISIPHVARWREKTPVLVDDIISTARTMVETVKHLKRAGMPAPVCIGVHAVFAGNAYDDLLAAGARSVHTCDTIPHQSNAISVLPLLTRGVAYLQESRKI